MTLEIVAWAGLLASLWLLIFQIALALGAPFGYLAWGGGDPGRLPPLRRASSLLAAGLVAVFAVAFGQALELWVVFGTDRLPWVFGAGAVVFALSTLGNALSSSRAERWHGVPVAATLALCSGAMVWPGL